MSEKVSFLRLNQIVRTRTNESTPLLPISKSTWWAGVRSGRFPAPVKIGPRTTVWRSEDIFRLIADLGGGRK